MSRNSDELVNMTLLRPRNSGKPDLTDVIQSRTYVSRHYADLVLDDWSQYVHLDVSEETKHNAAYFQAMDGVDISTISHKDPLDCDLFLDLPYVVFTPTDPLNDGLFLDLPSVPFRPVAARVNIGNQGTISAFTYDGYEPKPVRQVPQHTRVFFNSKWKKRHSIFEYLPNFGVLNNALVSNVNRLTMTHHIKPVNLIDDVSIPKGTTLIECCRTFKEAGILTRNFKLATPLVTDELSYFETGHDEWGTYHIDTTNANILSHHAQRVHSRGQSGVVGFVSKPTVNVRIPSTDSFSGPTIVYVGMDLKSAAFKDFQTDNLGCQFYYSENFSNLRHAVSNGLHLLVTKASVLRSLSRFASHYNLITISNRNSIIPFCFKFKNKVIVLNKFNLNSLLILNLLLQTTDNTPKTLVQMSIEASLGSKVLGDGAF